MASELLATFAFSHEAWLASHRLAAIGIRCRVSTLRAGLLGMVPAADARCELWVDGDDLDDAKRALTLEVIDGGRRQGSEPAACPACGAPWEPGFEQCWDCSRRP
jgi:hypothetical protein